MTREHPRDPPAETAVAAAVEATLDSQVTDVAGFEEGLNAVYRVDRCGEEPVVLKTATLATDEERLIEGALLSRLGEATDVPLPAVLATIDPSETVLDVAAVAMEHCDGRSVTDLRTLSPPAQRRLIAESGRHLAAIHEADVVDGFGPVRLDGDRLRSDPADAAWPDWFDALVDETLDGLRGAGHYTDADPRFADLEPILRDALQSPPRDGEWDPDPALLIGDYRPANLVLAPDGEADPIVRAVVDVDYSPTVDGLVDLALAEDALVDVPYDRSERAETLRTVFRTAYTGIRDVDPSVLASDRYARYRLYARARRMGAFEYWQQFAPDDDPDETARRWRSVVRDRLSALQ